MANTIRSLLKVLVYKSLARRTGIDTPLANKPTKHIIECKIPVMKAHVNEYTANVYSSITDKLRHFSVCSSRLQNSTSTIKFWNFDQFFQHWLCLPFCCLVKCQIDLFQLEIIQSHLTNCKNWWKFKKKLWRYCFNALNFKDEIFKFRL